MLLSARMFGILRRVEGGDDVVEVAQHLPVHLGEPLLAAGLGGGDQLQGLLAFLRVPIRPATAHAKAARKKTDIVRTPTRARRDSCDICLRPVRPVPRVLTYKVR